MVFKDIVCCLGTTVINNFNITMPIKIVHVSLSEIFLAYPAYLIGRVLKKYNDSLGKRIYTPLAMIISFTVLVLFDDEKHIISFSYGIVPNILFYISAIILGWIMIMSLSLFMNGKLKSCLAYIGSKSLSIVLWHLPSFKIITLIYLIIHSGNWILLASFPYLDCNCEYLWILYTWTGIAVPLGINYIYKKIKDRIINQNIE